MKFLKFKNGQIEKHFPDKSKIIYFPDGTQKVFKSDEYKETNFSEGNIQTIDRNEEINYKNNEQ